MSKSTPAARSKARRFALQALYSMRLTDCSAGDAESQLRVDNDMKRVDTEYLHHLLTGIQQYRGDLLEMVMTEAKREDELDPVEMAALLIGSFEVVHCLELPYRIAINEGVELAKKFGAAESHKLVNTVLDKLAQTHRSVEYGKRSS